MYQQKPQFFSTHQPKSIANLFQIQPSDFLPGYPVQTVSTGIPQLMIPLRNKDVLKNTHLNIDEYIAYKAKSDFSSPYLFCLEEGEEGSGITPFARHLGAPPDRLENSFTGSAAGAMAAYLWRYGLLKKPFLTAKQGDLMGRPGKAEIEVVGEPQNIEAVKVSGTVVTLIEGTLET